MSDVTAAIIVFIIVFIICIIATTCVKSFKDTRWEVFVISFASLSTVVTFVFYYYFVREADDSERFQAITSSQYYLDRITALHSRKRDSAWYFDMFLLFDNICKSKFFDVGMLTIFVEWFDSDDSRHEWQNIQDKCSNSTITMANRIFSKLKLHDNYREVAIEVY